MGRERQSHPLCVCACACLCVRFLDRHCHTHLNKLSCEGMSGFNEDKYDKFLIEYELKDETLFVEGH